MFVFIQDRAKLGAKRRPPTRHGRKATAASSTPTSPTENFFATTVTTSPTTSVTNDLDFDDSRVPPPLPGLFKFFNKNKKI